MLKCTCLDNIKEHDGLKTSFLLTINKIKLNPSPQEHVNISLELIASAKTKLVLKASKKTSVLQLLKGEQFNLKALHFIILFADEKL